MCKSDLICNSDLKLVFDNDCLASFVWIHRLDILEILYKGRMYVPQKARTIPELSIKTMEQWRVWLELKRVQGEIKVLMDRNTLNQGTLLQGFQINDIGIRVDSDEIIVETDEVKRFPHKDLAYNLRGVMKKIFGR